MNNTFRAALWWGWFLIATCFFWIHNWFRFAFIFGMFWFGTCFFYRLSLLFILVIILIFNLNLFFIQICVLIRCVRILLYFDLTYILWEFFWTINLINCLKIWIRDILIEFLLVFIILNHNFIFLLKIYFIYYIVNLIDFNLSNLFFIKNFLYLLIFLIQRLDFIIICKISRFCTLLSSFDKLLYFWKAFLYFELKLFLFSFLCYFIFKIDLYYSVNITSFPLNDQILFYFFHFH